jgi:hypothetical protein
MTCARRDTLSARALWLAAPLFIAPANERRVEQFVRSTLLVLRTALRQDERYDWNYGVGSDARAEMIRRYGWPTLIAWGGGALDHEHSGYLNHSGSLPNDPYTTYEYSPGRVHLVPAWSAILQPFKARADAWALVETPGADGRLAPLSAPWWPVEHFDLPYPLVQLRQPQVAVFRRQDAVVLATATDLDATPLRRGPSDTIPEVTLVVSDSPNAIQRVARAPGVVGETAVLWGEMTSRPVVAGVEFLADSHYPAARTRFGVTPPQALSAMKPGEVGISDAALLEPPVGDGAAPNEIGEALKHMLGSTRLEHGSGRLAVYWETYGFLPSDTVEVAVWIERYTPQGILRNLRIMLDVSQDLNTPVAITWKEPQPDHSARVTSGRVPIIARSIVLDVSKLPAGDYWLDVAVKKAGQQPVRTRTTFTVG